MVLPEFLNPSAEQVDELRQLFREKLEKDPSKIPVGGFHEHDLKRVYNVDVWLTKFLENNDLNMKDSLKQLWETMEWRAATEINEIREDNIRLEYIHDGLMFPRGCDTDGKTVFIFKSKLYVRGSRNLTDLKKCFLYWIERIIREANDDLVTIFFDLTEAGLSNVDMDYTKYIINTLKCYYPCSLNYILIYDLPWILNATFQLIKRLLPAKAVDRLRNISNKNIREYIDEDNMQKCWGGNDDYVFQFVPERQHASQNGAAGLDIANNNNNNNIPNGYLSKKQVHFANLSPPESPMNDLTKAGPQENGEIPGDMLQITPPSVIAFEKSGTDLVGHVEIMNVSNGEVTYKIKTTAPVKFRVRPSAGALPPLARATISVLLQQGQQFATINREKFLVMCMQFTPEMSRDPIQLGEHWRNVPANSPSVEQHRLKCVLSANMDEAALRNGTSAFGSTSGGDGDLYSASVTSDYGATGGAIGDKQMLHIQQHMAQMNRATRHLEQQNKMTHTLLWISLLLCLLLAIAVVYILKVEIRDSTSQYCGASHHRGWGEQE